MPRTTHSQVFLTRTPYALQQVMSLSSQSSAGIKDPSSDPPSVSSNNEGIDVKVQPENKSGGNNKSAEADRKKDEELKRISLTKMQWLSKVTMLKSQSGWKAYVFKMKMVFADLLVLDAFLVKVGEEKVNTFESSAHRSTVLKWSMKTALENSLSLDWQRRWARSIITLTVHDKLTHLIQKRAEHPAVMWAALAENFEPSDRLSVHDLYSKLHSLDIRDFKGNLNLISVEIQDIHKRLADRGETVSHGMLITCLIESLKPVEQYKEVRYDAAKETHDNLQSAVSNIKSLIQNREFGDRVENTPSINEANLYMQQNPHGGYRGRGRGNRYTRGRGYGRRGHRGRGRGGRGRGRGRWGRGRDRQKDQFSQNNQYQQNQYAQQPYMYQYDSYDQDQSTGSIQCYRCQKYGHIAKHCPDKKRKQQQ